eukprot:SAG22_NODE_217_length_14910_cov_65.532978_8_plen_932_part_00
MVLFYLSAHSYGAKLKGKKVEVKVTEMALQVFESGKTSPTDPPVESYMYQTLASWSDLPGKGFEIVPKDKDGWDSKAIVFRCNDVDGQAICMQIQLKAMDLVESFKAKRKELGGSSSDAEAEESENPSADQDEVGALSTESASEEEDFTIYEDSAEEVDSTKDDGSEEEPTETARVTPEEERTEEDTNHLLGTYKSLGKAKIRSGPDRESSEVGQLTVGEQVMVLETKTTESGQLRVRFERGWTSIESKEGKQLLVKLNDDGINAVDGDDKESGSASKNPTSSSGSTDASSLPTGLTAEMYDVKLKGKKMQIKVGGMGLQVFEKGRASETHMYMSMLSWGDRPGKGFEIIPKDGKEIVFTCADDVAKTIIAEMTKIAKELAASKKEAEKAAKEAEAAKADAPEGKEDAGAETTIADRGPTSMGSMDIRSEAKAAVDALSLPAALQNDMHNVKIKGKKVQVMVSGMGLQVFEKGRVLDTHVFQSLTSWKEVTAKGARTDGFEIVPTNGKPVMFTCSSELAQTLLTEMTDKAKELAASKRAAKVAKKAALEAANHTPATDTSEDDGEVSDDLGATSEEDDGPLSELDQLKDRIDSAIGCGVQAAVCDVLRAARACPEDLGPGLTMLESYAETLGVDLDNFDEGTGVGVETDAGGEETANPDVLGEYKAVASSTIRETVDLESEKIGAVKPGEVIEVTASETLETGQVRVQFDKGWTSLASAKGKKLFVKVGEEDEAEPEPEPAPAPAKKPRRRMSISGGFKANVAPAAAQDGMHDVKMKSKKVQVKVGGMGLDVFEKGRKLETHMYMSMLSWGDSPGKGLAIMPKDGKEVLFTCADDVAKTIIAEMTSTAQDLAKSKRAALKQESAREIAAAEAEAARADMPEDDATEADARKTDEAVITSISSDSNAIERSSISSDSSISSLDSSASIGSKE